MTLAEFLQPIRGGTKKQQLLATLYYFKHQDGRSQLSVGVLRSALLQAGIPRARKANLSDALAGLIPLVDRMGSGYWKITNSGEERVRELLALPASGPQVEEDVSSLTALSASVSDPTVREYVEEAIKCLQVGARRAAVVFLWAGAVHEIRERLWGLDRPAIEAALQARNPRARFRRKDDFSQVRDATLIEITGDLSVFDKSQRKRLNEALDLRNDCGHPVKYRPGEKKVASFIEDVIQVVFGASA